MTSPLNHGLVHIYTSYNINANYFHLFSERFQFDVFRVTKSSFPFTDKFDGEIDIYMFFLTTSAISFFTLTIKLRRK